MRPPDPASHDDPLAPARPGPSIAWRGLAILLMSAVAYYPALRCGFIWDDDYYVTGNPTLRDADGLRRIWFDVGATPQYYPLVHTSFWLEYQIWGMTPAGYHAVNVALHALVALLLWRVLVRLDVPGAWWAAAVFALHPVQVESVAWITERKNVLSSVFYFAAMLVYLKGTSEPRASARARFDGAEPQASACAKSQRAEPQASACAKSQRAEPQASACAKSQRAEPRASACAKSQRAEPQASACAKSQRAESRASARATAWSHEAAVGQSTAADVQREDLADVPQCHHAAHSAPATHPGGSRGLKPAARRLRGIANADLDGPTAPPPPAPLGPAWPYYAASLLLFLLALLSKTVTCSLPAALLLILWWRRGRVRLRDALPLLPMFAVGLALALLTVRMEAHTVGAVGEEWNHTFLERCLIAGRALTFYAAKLVWPSTLTFFYPRWQIDAANIAQYAPPLIVMVALTLAWRGRRRWGAGPLVALLCFCGTLFPALGFIDVYPMRYSYVADHFQYHASAYLIALLTAVAASLLYGEPRASARAEIRTGNAHDDDRDTPRERSDCRTNDVDALAGPTHSAKVTHDGSGTPRGLKPAARCRRPSLGALTAGLIVLGVLGTLTWRQTRVYANLETLWRDTIAKNPDAWMAHNNLGGVLQARGDVDEAIKHYHLAVRLRPDDAEARYNLAGAHFASSRLDDAIAGYRTVLELRPDHARAAYHLGRSYRRLGADTSAIENYLLAIERDPQFAEAHYALGIALRAVGRFDDAVAAYERAIQLKPDFAEAHNNLAAVLEVMGRPDEAIEHYRAAVRLAPSLATAHCNLADLLMDRGQADAATAHYQQAIAARPDYGKAHRGLAEWLGESGRPREALEHFRVALQADPADAVAMRGAAWIMATTSDAALRDPATALMLAARAVDLSERSNAAEGEGGATLSGDNDVADVQGAVPEAADAVTLDVLAAALAAGGDFPRAIAVAQRAQARAQQHGPPTLAQAIAARLDGYRAGKPFTRPPDQ